MKDRSELVEPRNFSDGRVDETSRMFQDAWAASHMPALRPTRGSGLGMVADVITSGPLLLPDPEMDVDFAHDATAIAPTASDSTYRTFGAGDIEFSSEGTERGEGACQRNIIVRALRREARRASSASGRFRWTGRRRRPRRVGRPARSAR